MNKKTKYTISNIVLFLLLARIILAVPAAPNKAKITGEVLSVEAAKYAHNDVTKLKIRIIESENIEGSFAIPNEIEAIAYHKNNDFPILQKIENGNTILAMITYAGDEFGGQWQAREVEIIESKVPVKKQNVFSRIWFWMLSLFGLDGKNTNLEISGKIVQTSSYCAGAPPPQGYIEELQKEKAFPNKKLYIREGSINLLSNKIMHKNRKLWM